ncbi:MAG: Ig-like domain-containing protein [Chloroflexota bacterium]
MAESALRKRHEQRQHLYSTIPLDRFDVIMLVAMAALVVAIGVAIARGDQIGLAVQNFGPTQSASSRAAIRVTFDDPVVAQSATLRLILTPPVPGKMTVAGNQITFRPDQALTQGQEYTVTLKAGIQGSAGRALKRDVQWEFRITPPRVVYLGPVDSLVQNLYLLDPTQNKAAEALTASTRGVVGYDIAPDGGSIVYAELQDNGVASLSSLDLLSGTSRLIYDCSGATCTNPVFRPDGGAVAFERSDLNVGTGVAPGVPRVWVLDLASSTAKPLFTDNQQLGYAPRWSPDGSKLAVFNNNAGGISVHDFASGNDLTIATVQGEVGQFSPDGKWLFFPKVIEGSAGGYVTHFVLVDLSSPYLVQTDLVPDSDPADDKEASWFPDSKHLVVARVSGGSQGLAAPQVFSVEVGTGKATPLIEDQSYSQSNLTISPSGDVLLLQRVPLSKPGARTELWTYSFASHELKQIVQNGTFARWLP